MPRNMKKPAYIEKNDDLIQAEKDGQAKLYAYCRAKAGRQAELSRLTGMIPAVISRMANGHTPVSMEAAVALEVASNGALKADELCPSKAGLLFKYTSLRTALPVAAA